MNHCSVLLPLPLPRCFTYTYGDDLRPTVAVGVRVVVPFGARRYYTGLVMEVGDPQVTPADATGVELKAVQRVMDSHPVVRPEGLKLWQWIASYYICTPGEVMRAALPSGMKPEGDSPEAEVEECRPRTVRMVQLVLPEAPRCEGDDLAPEINARLTECFALVERAERQQKLLIKLLDASGVMTSGVAAPVEQGALLQAVGCTSAVVREMQRKGIVTVVEREVSSLPAADMPTTHPAPLSVAQQEAHDAIVNALERQDVCLLHGVTSSGKTEIYMHLMERCIASGRSVLMMLPEIALTTQLTERLRRVFGSTMVVYHSKLSDRQRVEIWNLLIDDDRPRLVVGVRSSVLLPLHNLGLIVVDEEHEPSFKQQDPAPRYHGRDTALVLAHIMGAKVLLGSATPSLESYYLARQGKYALVTLTQRHGDRPLPQIEPVSTLEPRRDHAMAGPFTPRLLQQMRHTLMEGRQVILFQNRRGFAPLVECPSCTWSPRCPRCDVSLTYHKATRRLTCHYCGYTQPIPGRCPSCGGEVMEQVGYGTERIEESVRQLLPQARTSRMDTDTTAGRNSYDRLLGEFAQGKSNVLIGTQMVSKGLDFSGVSLVGVLGADAMMKMPDFRAAERAFQLMEQVAGRAGRHGGGRVLIQCSDPLHPLMRRVVAHDYEGMARDQLRDRQRFGYPPFTRMIALYVKGRYEDRTDRLAQHYASLLRQVFGDRVLGPDAPVVARVKSFYIRMVLIKVERDAPAAEVRRGLLWADEVMQKDADYKRAVIYYDVDPM